MNPRNHVQGSQGNVYKSRYIYKKTNPYVHIWTHNDRIRNNDSNGYNKYWEEVWMEEYKWLRRT